MAGGADHFVDLPHGRAPLDLLHLVLQAADLLALPHLFDLILLDLQLGQHRLLVDVLRGTGVEVLLRELVVGAEIRPAVGARKGQGPGPLGGDLAGRQHHQGDGEQRGHGGSED